jgi:lipoprotein-releasing system permease protein
VNVPFYIARRYLISRSKTSAINIITGIASGGIIVSAMALFVVLSVFSGLRNFSMSFSNDFDPDLKITATLGKSFSIAESQRLRLGQTKGVSSFSEVIEERVLFIFSGKEKVAYLKGVDSFYTVVNDVKKSLYNGQWVQPGTYQAVVGYGIANNLSMGLFDFNNVVETYVPKPGKGDISNPEQAFSKSNLVPVGIYAINEDLDAKFVFADIDLVRELLQYRRSQVSAIEIKLKPGADAVKVSEQLEPIFDNKVTIRTRAEQNESLYKMLNTENTVIYLIFTLVIVLTLFTLAGAIIMMILDKKGNLLTLFNLGVEIRGLRKIFMLHGTLISVIGGCIGLALGAVIVLTQQRFNLILITESLPYPVEFNFQNIVIVLVTIIPLGLLSSWIASSRVSQRLWE